MIDRASGAKERARKGNGELKADHGGLLTRLNQATVTPS
jgi:hypothetical protein